MRLHVMKAAEGDGLLLESGEETPRRLLIDGGPRGCWEQDVRPYLKDVLGADGSIDALLISHVDNDHIVAPLDLLADLERSRANDAVSWPRISELWHNSFERTVDRTATPVSKQLGAVMARATAASVTSTGVAWALQGIKEGARLRRDALREGIALNLAFGGGLISPDELTDPVVDLGSMTLRVVGPTASNLDALRAKWAEWAADAARKRKPADLANIDKSVPNLSSIVMLASESDRTALLTGDARGDHIEQGLAQAGLLDDGRFHTNVLKLQHHGSARNVEQSFFERITADRYVVSANGRYNNPDVSTLVWIVEAARTQGREVELIATYETPSLANLRISHPPAAGWYSIRVAGEDEHAVVVEV